ncbi:MAG TPA: glycine cleavage T C-terminal barrel domain-containing protein [Candidatus Udaeobacter sp.]|nr:glycine cleavage T C-terminal barrel domain-containing protein [Candidatus Udaeobacter sp.]
MTTSRSQTGQAIFFDLSGRAKFRITGMDRLRFLNGQITNDLRKASETLVIEACVLNAKGKIAAHVFVSVSGECFFVDAEPELRETLKVRLERYVIADDVQIEDVTDQFSLFHVLSQQSPAPEYGRIISVRRFAKPGWDIWDEAAQHDAVLHRLSSKFARCDSDAAEAMRIEQGIPRWSRELTEEIIPIEANLEQRTIDYQKGCYIGQEVISRMKMSGQTNKRLCGLISRDNIPLQPGMKLAPPSVAGKEVGWITSATRSEGQEIALGYVKRGFNNVGTTLEAVTAAQPIRVEVVPLPFV